MLRVRKEDLRLGMFIHALDGSWFDHPFWKSKFLLEDSADLRALRRELAAVITPSGDPYSMLMLAVPMSIFYLISIVIGKVFQRRRTANATV